MKKFILKVLLFFLIIAIGDRVFGVVMDNVLKETEKGDWGRNNFIFNGVRSDVIIFGSSRAIHHYNPQIISDTLGMSCYNCGEDGMGIFLMWVRYQAIRERYTPKLVIYEVLPEFDLLENLDNLKYLKYMRPYSEMPTVKSVIGDISFRESVKSFSEMYRYNSAFTDIIAQHISKSPATAKEYTYTPVHGQMNYNIPRVENKGNVVSLDSLKLAYMKGLIRQCKEDGTILIFTASPIYRPLSDKDYSPLKDLCCMYDVPFVNHYCDADYCKDSAYFADASHLNVRGAELFTAIVASEIKNCIQVPSDGI